MDSLQSNSQLAFLQKLARCPQNYVEMQGTQNNLNNIKKEQSWGAHTSQIKSYCISKDSVGVVHR